MRSKQSSHDDSPDIMMEPMIDCVFLLLIFFLVAATIRPVHREVPITVPSFGNTIEEKEDHQTPLFLRLVIQSESDDTGRIDLSNSLMTISLREGVQGEPQTLTRDELLTELANAGSSRKPIFLETSRNMPYGTVVETLGLLELYQVPSLGMRFIESYHPTF